MLDHRCDEPAKDCLQSCNCISAGFRVGSKEVGNDFGRPARVDEGISGQAPRITWGALH